jgi:hypothetical protein
MLAEEIVKTRQETPGDGERMVAEDEDRADLGNPAWNVLLLDASSDARKCTAL